MLLEPGGVVLKLLRLADGVDVGRLQVAHSGRVDHRQGLMGVDRGADVVADVAHDAVGAGTQLDVMILIERHPAVAGDRSADRLRCDRHQLDAERLNDLAPKRISPRGRVGCRVAGRAVGGRLGVGGRLRSGRQRAAQLDPQCGGHDSQPAADRRSQQRSGRKRRAATRSWVGHKQSSAKNLPSKL